MPEHSSVIEPYVRVRQAREKKYAKALKMRRLNFPAGLISWETAGACAALVLLTNLRLMGELAPFGLAFWAVATRGERYRLLLYGLIALTAAFISGGIHFAAGMFLAMLVFGFLRYKLSRPRLPLIVIVGLALPAGMLPVAWLSQFHTYDVLLLVLEAILAMLSAAVFMQVYRHPPAKLAPDKHIEGITSWIVFLGLLLLALMQGGGILTQVSQGLARLIVMAAALAFGPGMAAAAGALLGFFLGIQGVGFIWAGVLAFAGFLAGLFRPYGKVFTALGFLLATTSLSLYISGWESVPMEAAVTSAAIMFFLLGPVFPERLQALAPFVGQGAEDEAEKVRELTAVRIKDYALVFRELAAAFQQVAALEKREKEPPMASTVEAVVERVCKFCPSRRRCWEKDAQRTYNAMLRVLADLNSGQNIREIKGPDFFVKICRKKDDFLRAVHLVHELESYQQNCNMRLEEGRELMTIQLAGLSQIMLELSKEVRQGVGEMHQRSRHQFFHVEIGVAQAAKGDADVCGDYYSYLELRDGKQAFILSDGMGNGSKAHQESRSAVQLVEQLLLAGFRNEAVVRTVNTILQLRSSEENFATLDVLLVDTEHGEAEFLKIGAAPSYLRHSGRVREIKSPSVPLGILNDVELKPVKITLDDDALIVMATDGIFEVLPSQPDWLKKSLASHDLHHPQVLADEVIHQSRLLSGRPELRDDVTVLVCRAKRLKHKIRDMVS
ncbi:SpoIIE family protein phosphatase [Dethiobacter alkaliphilus]|uniref:SpoIIE family protein phosphatase n=1 Tax=Dethiobacter alkaliphilus TaxID=427926 RepID=UPI002226DA5A|nr:SpoIIE family protein phosphatase [Dethiobacter alkaliphilus]MCW3489143.1 SpoIIE family protein phosphatase [Dethiobacter alkaliphilus]